MQQSPDVGGLTALLQSVIAPIEPSLCASFLAAGSTSLPLSITRGLMDLPLNSPPDLKQQVEAGLLGAALHRSGADGHQPGSSDDGLGLYGFSTRQVLLPQLLQQPQQAADSLLGAIPDDGGSDGLDVTSSRLLLPVQQQPQAARGRCFNAASYGCLLYTSDAADE